MQKIQHRGYKHNVGPVRLTNYPCSGLSNPGIFNVVRLHKFYVPIRGEEPFLKHKLIAEKDSQGNVPPANVEQKGFGAITPAAENTDAVSEDAETHNEKKRKQLNDDSIFGAFLNPSYKKSKKEETAGKRKKAQQTGSGIKDECDWTQLTKKFKVNLV